MLRRWAFREGVAAGAAGTDPRRTHAPLETPLMPSRQAPATITGRTVVADSWRRSLAAGVDPGLRAAPLVFDADALPGLRRGHPLDRHLPALRATLRGTADASAHLMVITDARGHVLWSEGPRGVRR